MAVPIYVNQTQQITVTFYGFLGEDVDPEPEDPTTVEVRIYNTDTTPDTLLDTVTPDGGDSTGQFVYLWTPTTTGNFNVQFFGEFFDSSTDVVNNFFTVYEDTNAPISNTLEADQTILYLGVLDPMYLDPAEIQLIFPDATNVEISELIHQFSLEVKKIEKLQDDEDPSYTGLEYIYAATCCSLSRIYDDISAGSEASFRLGDLEVSNRGTSKTTVNRGNATSWCELAAALRAELLANNVGLKRLSKGRGAGDCPWLIPSRKLKRYDAPANVNTPYEPYPNDSRFN